jgi:hypothetical protein
MLWKPTDPLERGRRLNRRRGCLRRFVRKCWRRTTRRFRRFRRRLGQRHPLESQWKGVPRRCGLRLRLRRQRFLLAHLGLERRHRRQLVRVHRRQRWKIQRRAGQCLGQRRGGRRLCFLGERRRRMRGVRRHRELAVGREVVVVEDLGLRVELRARRERRCLVGRRFRGRVRRHLVGGRRLVGRRCREQRRGGRAGLGRRRCLERAGFSHLR